MSVIREEAEVIRGLFDEGGAEKGYHVRYRTALDLVDAEGVSFSPDLVDPSLRGMAKQCYKNAGSFALFDDPARFVYVEGFAVLAGIPLSIAHAWVYDLKEDRALEVTWETPGAEYLGIPLDTEWFRAWILLRNCWGVLDSPAILRNDADPEKYFHKKFRTAKQ
ncbi:MAG: hypothetical protein ABL984_00365 [Pyrinomonadaceae bacterium]